MTFHEMMLPKEPETEFLTSDRGWRIVIRFPDDTPDKLAPYGSPEDARGWADDAISEWQIKIGAKTL